MLILLQFNYFFGSVTHKVAFGHSRQIFLGEKPSLHYLFSAKHQTDKISN